MNSLQNSPSGACFWDISFHRWTSPEGFAASWQFEIDGERDLRAA